MSHEDNDAAPTPNHALVASLLPTIRPPAALLQPDGHTKRATAQAVIGKVQGLLMMAGLLGSVYAFGVLTSGTDCMQRLPQVRWSIGGSQPLTIAVSTISTRQASFPLPVLVCYQVRQRSPNCHQG